MSIFTKEYPLNPYCIKLVALALFFVQCDSLHNFTSCPIFFLCR